MPKIKSRPETVDSLYVKDATPMWQPKQKPPIPTQYSDAIKALADWSGPQWHVNEETRFFHIRDELYQAAQAWQNYDWKSDEIEFHSAKQEQQAIKEILRFRASICAAHDERVEQFLQSSALSALRANHPIHISVRYYASAVRQGLNALCNTLPSSLAISGSYGPLEFEGFPTRLPSPEIAVAVLLADIVTKFRCDLKMSPQVAAVIQSKWDKLPPRTSPKLPWKAIGLFSCTGPEGPDPAFNIEGIQTRVASARKNVASLRRRPISKP